MKASIQKVVVAMVVAFVLFSATTVRAEPTREFIMSCTYGVLAGTLVGAATLAFTDKPGDNLKNIARGASFGLYAGILLGLYVVYGIPSGDEPIEEPGPGPDDEEAPPEEEARLNLPMVYPLISEKGVEGAGIAYQLLSF